MRVINYGIVLIIEKLFFVKTNYCNILKTLVDPWIKVATLCESFKIWQMHLIMKK